MAPDLFYALPSLVSVSPRPRAYYRLLLGYSSKLAYSQDGGLKLFASAESRGVLSLDQEKTKLKSPTTMRFYHLQQITDASSEQYQDFVTRIRSFTGLAEKAKG